MIYRVRARYIEDRLAEFFEKLTDGTILNQEPDGREIVASMRRARVTSPGVVEWSEKCFCEIPLDHERRTVYDRYFTDFEDASVEDHIDFDGEYFWDVLEKAEATKL